MSENYHEVTNLPSPEELEIEMEEVDKMITELSSGAADRIHKSVAELQEAGIIDENGKLLNKGVQNGKTN